MSERFTIAPAETEDLQLWRALGNSQSPNHQSVAEVRIGHLLAKGRREPLLENEQRELASLTAKLRRSA